MHNFVYAFFRFQYAAHREDFEQRYGKPDERLLFHGCQSTSADQIIEACFNRSFAGVNGKQNETPKFLPNLLSLYQALSTVVAFIFMLKRHTVITMHIRIMPANERCFSQVFSLEKRRKATKQ